jgi:magnesium-transporting ATPase (P-type)
VLLRGQWVHLIFLGLIIAAATLLVEWYYTPVDPAQALTMGFVVFSLLSVALGLNARTERETILSRELFPGWRQAALFGVALLFVFLGTALLQGISGTTPLTSMQWAISLLLTAGLVALDEVIKFFMRRQRH